MWTFFSWSPGFPGERISNKKIRLDCFWLSLYNRVPNSRKIPCCDDSPFACNTGIWCWAFTNLRMQTCYLKGKDYFQPPIFLTAAIDGHDFVIRSLLLRPKMDNTLCFRKESLSKTCQNHTESYIQVLHTGIGEGDLLGAMIAKFLWVKNWKKGSDLQPKDQYTPEV